MATMMILNMKKFFMVINIYKNINSFTTHMNCKMEVVENLYLIIIDNSLNSFIINFII